jgi:glycosyltransferase involved in cell wall biosynthesis
MSRGLAKNRPVRILHVITALGVGGAENMLLKLLGSEALSEMDQRVVALLPGGAMAAPMRATGASVEEFDLLGSLPVISGTLALVRHARTYAADVLQGWMYHGNLGATVARAAQRRRVPLVWGIRQSLNSLDGENAYARVGIHMSRRLSGGPDRILFNSRTSLEQHRRFGFRGERMQYLANGFDTDRFRADAASRVRFRAEWEVRDGGVVFGLIARYHPAKNHAGFLQAAREVLTARPEAHFVMAGTGVTRDNAELSALIADLDLTRRVHCLGERHDVPSVMAALDVCVSSSTAIEAFSNSIGEAMSCSVPCVVTAVGDSPDVVNDTGRIVPPDNPVSLGAAMIEMMDAGPEVRHDLGERARARISAEYSLESVAGRYASLYRELIGDGREVA